MKEGKKKSAHASQPLTKAEPKRVKKKSITDESHSHDFILKHLRKLENKPSVLREQSNNYPSTSLPGISDEIPL